MSDLSGEFELEPDSADNLGHVWVVQLAFWRPATLADDEMETLFPERDGRWSRQTREATRLAEWLLQENARFGEDDARSKAEYRARKAAENKSRDAVALADHAIVTAPRRLSEWLG